jgi:hypothetical protein
MIVGSALWPCCVTFRPTTSHQTAHTLFHPCPSFRTLSVTYAMMESRTSREAQHLAGRRRGGLCRGPGSSDHPPSPAGPGDLSDLKRQFQLDDTALDDLTVELIKGQRLAANEGGEVLVWTGNAASSPALTAVPALASAPLSYTPPRLAEKILVTADLQLMPACRDTAETYGPTSTSLSKASRGSRLAVGTSRAMASSHRSRS